MSNVMDVFEHLNSWSDVQLHARRNELVGSAPSGDYRQLSDEALQELVAIHRILRKKAAPAARINGSSRKAPAPTLDNL